MPKCSYENCQFDWEDEWTFYDDDGKSWCGMHAKGEAKTLSGIIKNESSIVNDCLNDNVNFIKWKYLTKFPESTIRYLNFKGVVFPEYIHTTIEDIQCNSVDIDFVNCSGGMIHIFQEKIMTIQIINSKVDGLILGSYFWYLNINHSNFGYIRICGDVNASDDGVFECADSIFNGFFLYNINLFILKLLNCKFDFISMETLNIRFQCQFIGSTFEQTIELSNSDLSNEIIWFGVNFKDKSSIDAASFYRKLKMLCRKIGDDNQAKVFEEYEIESHNNFFAFYNELQREEEAAKSQGIMSTKELCSKIVEQMRIFMPPEGKGVQTMWEIYKSIPNAPARTLESLKSSYLDFCNRQNIHQWGQESEYVRKRGKKPFNT